MENVVVFLIGLAFGWIFCEVWKMASGAAYMCWECGNYGHEEGCDACGRYSTWEMRG
jgi:hypothetical protein